MQSTTKLQQQPLDDQWELDTTQFPGRPPDTETPEKLRANCHRSVRLTTDGYGARPAHAPNNQEIRVTPESIKVLPKTVFAPQPVQPPETASYTVAFAFGASNAFAIHYR